MTTAIPIDADAQCDAVHVIWHRSGHIEQRCERAAGHDGKHRVTMHLRRRGHRRGPWVHEWGGQRGLE